MKNGGANNVGPAGREPKPIQAYDGIKTDTIKEKGTKADARSVDIFDRNNDGKLSASEVSVFNNTKRELSDDGKKLTLQYNLGEFSNNVEITQSNDNLEKSSIRFYGSAIEIDYQNGDASLSGGIYNNPYEADSNAYIKLNLDENKVSVSGAHESNASNIEAANMEVNISNSTFDTIKMKGGTLNADKLYDTTSFGIDIDADVYTDGKTMVNVKDSDVDFHELE